MTASKYVEEKKQSLCSDTQNKFLFGAAIVFCSMQYGYKVFFLHKPEAVGEANKSTKDSTLGRMLRWYAFFCVAPLLLSSSTSERCHISIRKSNNGKVRVAFHLKVKQKECSQGYTLASEITFPEAILPFSNMGRGRAGTSGRCGRERRWGNTLL